MVLVVECKVERWRVIEVIKSKCNNDLYNYGYGL